eukprot:scaffold196200_cov29-Tisochrysis_lutea.AAC.4
MPSSEDSIKDEEERLCCTGFVLAIGITAQVDHYSLAHALSFFTALWTCNSESMDIGGVAVSGRAATI